MTTVCELCLKILRINPCNLIILTNYSHLVLYTIFSCFMPLPSFTTYLKKILVFFFLWRLLLTDAIFDAILDRDIWFMRRIRPSKPQRCSSRHMVSSVIWYNTAWLATCMNHWNCLLTLGFWYVGHQDCYSLTVHSFFSFHLLVHFLYYTYAYHIYEIVLYFYHSESKKLYFYMNSKFLRANRQGNVEAWELVSFFP